MEIRLLKFTCKYENVLCIYRNFGLYQKIFQVLIILRIILEFIIITIHSWIRFNYYPKCKTDVFYYYLTSCNSVLVILLALYHSKSFERLTDHLNTDCICLNKDEKYRRNLEVRQSAFIVLVILFCVAKLALFSFDQLFPKVFPDITAFWHYLLQLNLLVCDFRYIFEYMVVYCVLHIMSEQLQVLTRAIEHTSVIVNDQEQTDEIDKWSDLYKDIRESSKMFNSIFGLQLTVMLTTVISYYIIFLYSLTSQSLTGRIRSIDILVYVATLFLMLTILYMVSRAAQQMQNSAGALRIGLCKLLIVYLSCEKNYKCTKDLLRLVSTRPIRARVFGSINLDMTLLPTCVSFFTSYTVIALQFNNVL